MRSDSRFPGRRPPLRDEGYRGPVRSARYFEGWYLRQVTPDRSRSLAVIVGLSLAPDPHAFIQILSGPGGEVMKFRYGLDELTARRDRFDVRLGSSRFTPGGIDLEIVRDSHRIEGHLKYSGRTEYPRSLVSPGIMGPFSFVPFMECIHGLVSMDHRVEGDVSIDGVTISFDGGRGYIEKDRGSSMPRQWIWAHTNQFEQPGDSLMLSVARIPWLGGAFNGHLGFLYHDGRLFRFGTYTGSRVRGRRTDGGLELSVSDTRRILNLSMRLSSTGGSLDAPVDGAMVRRIIESPDAAIAAELREHGRRVWAGEAGPAAVEVAGDPTPLLGL